MNILPRRKITGYSAVLLPFREDGTVDWGAFSAHVARTDDAGLMPAVNMDTGYGNLIDEATRLEVLHCTRDTLSGKPFTAGAFVGASFNRGPSARSNPCERVRCRRNPGGRRCSR